MRWSVKRKKRVSFSDRSGSIFDSGGLFGKRYESSSTLKYEYACHTRSLRIEFVHAFLHAGMNISDHFASIFNCRRYKGKVLFAGAIRVSGEYVKLTKKWSYSD